MIILTHPEPPDNLGCRDNASASLPSNHAAHLQSDFRGAQPVGRLPDPPAVRRGNGLVGALLAAAQRGRRGRKLRGPPTLGTLRVDVN